MVSHSNDVHPIFSRFPIPDSRFPARSAIAIIQTKKYL